MAVLLLRRFEPSDKALEEEKRMVECMLKLRNKKETGRYIRSSHYPWLVTGAAILVVVAFFLSLSSIQATFKMYIDGSEVQLNQSDDLNGCIYFDEGFVSVHCDGTTIRDLLESVNATQYPSGRNVFVVVNSHSAFYDTVIHDKDKILITDADDYNDIMVQMLRVG